jgi:hypothetical protein
LNLFGYSVGAAGLRGRDRRELLEDFLFLQLPAQWPGRDEWFQPATRSRLKKMISFLEWRVMMAERNTAADYSEAIRELRDDIRWLRVTFSQQR